MKIIKTQTTELIAVELTEEYDKFKFSGLGFLCGWDTRWHVLPLDTSNIKGKILGKLSDLSEVECSKFVDVTGGKLNGTMLEYKDYGNEYNEYYSYFETAKQSFTSLLQHNGMETNKSILIIEKL